MIPLTICLCARHLWLCLHARHLWLCLYARHLWLCLYARHLRLCLHAMMSVASIRPQVYFVVFRNSRVLSKLCTLWGSNTMIHYYNPLL